MRQPPTVAVIIPTYNRVHFLVQALESVLNQSRPPDEILVVDDGSTDATAEALVEYKSRIQYLRKPNGGLPSALNYGLAATNADYVGILDDDDLAMPDTLARHLEFLRSHPDIDFSYSGCYRFCSDTPPKPPYVERLPLYDCADIAPADLFLRALESYPFHTQSLLVPLRCYRTIGGFDETRRRSEDYDMILRLSHKFRGAKVGAPTFLLREHGGDRGPAQERHGIQDRDRIFLSEGKKLFADLRGRLPLADYVQREDGAKPLTEAQTRQALLQRACVMARHGLFDEALEDLTEVFNVPYSSHPFAPCDRRICNLMFDLEPDLLQGKGRWLEKVSQLFRKEGAKAAFEAGTAGLFWSLNREWRHKSRHGTAILAGSLLRFAGARTVPMIINRARVRLLK